MTRYLCISVTLLDPFFHGKGDPDVGHPDGQPEWPPSPMRLFQALLAGSRIGCRNERWVKADDLRLPIAFSWLEKRDPPVIITPAAQRVSAYRFFVPNNDADAPNKFDRQDRLASEPKVVRPHRIGSAASDTEPAHTLHYLWMIPENEWAEARLHVELLCCEARKLLALGWGIDQAVANGRVLNDDEVEALRGRRWKPWEESLAGEHVLRVPRKGTLDDLGRAYEAFVDRLRMTQPPKAREPRVYSSVPYLPIGMLPARPPAVFELPEGVAFRQEDACAVAAMLRSLVCDDKRYRNRQDFQALFPRDDPEVYLAGHVNDTKQTPPRFSYLPLPSVGHEHADGMIRRLLIVEPFGGDGSYARWAQNRLRGLPLTDEDGNERGILLDLWRRTSANMVMRYIDDARTWSTATPVILPGFDDGKQVKAEKLFITAVQQAELPVDAIEELSLRKAPFWPGSQHPSQYHVPAYLKHFSRWHVRLVFRPPIGGPLAIGAGRHCGLGLFAAVQSP